MSQFSLLKNLTNEHEKLLEQKTSSGHNITYQQYNVDIDNKEVGVLIPLRECEKFENTLLEVDNLTHYRLKKILREHRGIFVRK